jgi:Arc/MetJ family transcription regulator
VSRTVIDLDEDSASSMARKPGANPKKDTVNAAPREVPGNRRRALALTQLRDATSDEAFDLALLQDKRNYRR